MLLTESELRKGRFLCGAVAVKERRDEVSVARNLYLNRLG